MSTWAFKSPLVRFKKNDRVQVTRSLSIPGVGIVHIGEVGVVKDISPSGEPLVELENKNPFYINPQFLKKL
ncbi:hypothetical protein J7L81_03020 [Candidatus Aerophobetes bacterium]|nr:hypothetical protein [Candidatus Aerophobetes bacterium]